MSEQIHAKYKMKEEGNKTPPFFTALFVELVEDEDTLLAAMKQAPNAS